MLRNAVRSGRFSIPKEGESSKSRHSASREIITQLCTSVPNGFSLSRPVEKKSLRPSPPFVPPNCPPCSSAGKNIREPLPPCRSLCNRSLIWFHRIPWLHCKETAVQLLLGFVFLFFFNKGGACVCFLFFVCRFFRFPSGVAPRLPSLRFPPPFPLRSPRSRCRRFLCRRLLSFRVGFGCPLCGCRFLPSPPCFFRFRCPVCCRPPCPFSAPGACVLLPLCFSAVGVLCPFGFLAVRLCRRPPWRSGVRLSSGCVPVLPALCRRGGFVAVGRRFVAARPGSGSRFLFSGRRFGGTGASAFKIKEL